MGIAMLEGDLEVSIQPSVSTSVYPAGGKHKSVH